MTQNLNDKDDLDPCPDEEVLTEYFEGGDSEDVRRIIKNHLKFCASCRSKLESMDKSANTPDEKMVEILAHRLKQRQQQILQKQSRGPVLGTIWRTVPESEQDLYGPMVIVIDEKKYKTDIVQVAEISEDIPQAIETDMILEPTESRLSFRCMIRTGNSFFTEKKNLKTFAGELSPSLTEKVVIFCKAQSFFNENVPLSEYVFLKDRVGSKLMRRRGVSSGMPVTKDDDSRLNFLEQSKQRCSYLHYEQEMPRSDVATEPVAARIAGGKVRSSLVKNLWPIAAMILVAVVSVKITQLIMEANFKSRMPVTAAERVAAEQMRQVKFDPVKGQAVLAAVQSQDMAVLKKLLQDEQYVNYRDDKTGITPLLTGVSAGVLGTVAFLIAKKAFVNAADNKGETPLIEAAKNGNRDMVELLLKNGADARMYDMDGRTALYWALANKHDDIAEMLRPL